MISVSHQKLGLFGFRTDRKTHGQASGGSGTNSLGVIVFGWGKWNSYRPSTMNYITVSPCTWN